MKAIPAILLSLALGACATAPPDRAVAVRTVEVPVAVRCQPNLGPEPAYPDTDEALKAAPDLFARVRLLLAGRLMRMGRDAEKSAALQACAGQGG
ncbi:MAG: hypothetical protein P4L64_06860 [Caulobacteraceae bacterium]|nr:hypothetical protein [Caulobacteraceae bacterium]